MVFERETKMLVFHDFMLILILLNILCHIIKSKVTIKEPEKKEVETLRRKLQVNIPFDIIHRL